MSSSTIFSSVSGFASGLAVGATANYLGGSIVGCPLGCCCCMPFIPSIGTIIGGAYVWNKFFLEDSIYDMSAKVAIYAVTMFASARASLTWWHVNPSLRNKSLLAAIGGGAIGMLSKNLVGSTASLFIGGMFASFLTEIAKADEHNKGRLNHIVYNYL